MWRSERKTSMPVSSSPAADSLPWLEAQSHWLILEEVACHWPVCLEWHNIGSKRHHFRE